MDQLYHTPAVHCLRCLDSGEMEVFCPENGKDWVPCEDCNESEVA